MQNLSEDIDSIDMSKLPNIKDLLIATLSSTQATAYTKPNSTAIKLDLDTLIVQNAN